MTKKKSVYLETKQVRGKKVKNRKEVKTTLKAF